MASASNALLKRKYVGTAETFAPPKSLKGEIQTMIFKVHKFAEREEKHGEYFKTTRLMAHGREWCLWIYPRGDSTSKADEVWTSVFLAREKGDEIEGKYEIKTGSLVKNAGIHLFSNGKPSWGWHVFVKRSTFLDPVRGYLDRNGTATFEVHFEVVSQENLWYPIIIRNDPIVSKLRLCESTRDVVFRAGNNEHRVHGSILELRAPALFEVLKEKLQERQQPIPPVDIPDCASETFGKIVEHVYTVLDYDTISDTLEETQDLLLAADRFGCTDLKLYLESKLVEKHLSIETAAALLVFADRYSCALLKEAAMKVYFCHPKEIMQSLEWSMIVESNALLTELLGAATLGARIAERDLQKTLTADYIASLDVTSLRKRLDAADLDMDGSRETLVRRLTAHMKGTMAD
jgi:BTB/POZ domain